MFSLPPDFPLSIVTHPLAIAAMVLGLVSAFLLGIIFLAAGRKPSDLESFKQRLEENSKWPWFQSFEDTWRKRLRSWQVVTDGDDSAVLKEVIVTWDLIQSRYKFILGLAMVVLAPLDLLLVIFTKGAILRNLPVLLVLASLFSIAHLLGGCIAYSIGFQRVKQAVHSRMTYADVRKRRLSDYRSVAFRWLLGLLVGANSFLLLGLPSSLGLSSSAPPAWERLIICLAMLLICVVGEICMSRIVMLPRLVMTSDPMIAQHADDMLRALTVNDIHRKMIGAFGTFMYYQWFFFLVWLLSSPFLIGMQIVVTLLWLFCNVFVGWRERDQGRLGGSRTGWPWQVRSVS